MHQLWNHLGILYFIVFTLKSDQNIKIGRHQNQNKQFHLFNFWDLITC